jgi:hypothetical protein
VRPDSNRRKQKQLRKGRAEKAFLFDKDLSRCFGEVDREDWELSISANGGSVADAAEASSASFHGTWFVVTSRGSGYGSLEPM